jgi:hypothetical protein
MQLELFNLVDSDKQTFKEIHIKTQDDLKLAWSKNCDTIEEEQANGIIFTNDEKKKIVARAQKKIIKATPEQITNALANPDTIAEYCEDGTVIRLYHYNDTWHTATPRCIDGKNSYFSAKKTFDEMFWELFDRTDTSHLDTMYTYVFILLHVENRIVVKHEQNKLVFVCNINNETGMEFYEPPELTFTTLTRLQQIDVSNGITDFMQKGLQDKRGIILKVPNDSGTMYTSFMIDFDAYKTVKRVRGNSPDVVYRYLSLLQDDESMMLFRKNYSEHLELFSRINKELYSLYKKTFKMYLDTYVYRTITHGHDHNHNHNHNHNYNYILRAYHKEYKAKGSRLMEEDAIRVFYNIRAYKLFPLINLC